MCCVHAEEGGQSAPGLLPHQPAVERGARHCHPKLLLLAYFIASICYMISAHHAQVRELAGHTNRVSAIAWNGAVLSSGGRDGLICNWDVRQRKDQALVATLRGHEQEVCGLKWSASGQLASGGNDNVLCIWDASYQLQHRIAAHSAAVKALAWCPFQSNLLASGGGTADRCIRFWNTSTGAMLNSVDTGSQVRWMTGGRCFCTTPPSPQPSA